MEVLKLIWCDSDFSREPSAGYCGDVHSLSNDRWELLQHWHNQRGFSDDLWRLYLRVLGGGVSLEGGRRQPGCSSFTRTLLEELRWRIAAADQTWQEVSQQRISSSTQTIGGKTPHVHLFLGRENEVNYFPKQWEQVLIVWVSFHLPSPCTFFIPLPAATRTRWAVLTHWPEDSIGNNTMHLYHHCITLIRQHNKIRFCSSRDFQE